MQIADVAAEASSNPEFILLNAVDAPAFVVAGHPEIASESLCAQVIVLKKARLC